MDDDLGMSETVFRPWELGQVWLLLPSVRDFVPDGHLSHFARITVRNDSRLAAATA